MSAERRRARCILRKPWVFSCSIQGPFKQGSVGVIIGTSVAIDGAGVGKPFERGAGDERTRDGRPARPPVRTGRCHGRRPGGVLR